MSRVFHYEQVRPSCMDGDTIDVRETHRDDVTGLRQAVYHVRAGRSRPRSPGAGRLETLFVLSGDGTLHVNGESHPLRAELAVLVVGEDAYEITTDSEVVLVSVSARQQPDVVCGDYRPWIDLADQVKQDAVSDREYQTLFDPGTGCSGVTQFVGYIPAIRTPMHYHPYSEMVFVLSGTGQVEIEGSTSTIGAGSCFYLPAGVHHLVENLGGEGFLRLLGVFVPAGSPSENSPV
ncbi:mannose-6-phosphate isomerase-like protein (cupin superfamily) [Saccharothrix tamanrassetensis]|uniref:Mannose-6-phosphate isomerase-like protein (Cupin superfamily) n=1 Tax=Saccharothrix tamanrassetensis TaxID=1051531 RepID=A0A841CSA3_9PSEU|nr:cupin domain-containing protein [Saccharothrix tamanrassetensis]MBB5959743.1 mannose-6-phosphate isomerase-like protein (cupin superfamily) [Saccharothrix tamanrassetensis]